MCLRVGARVHVFTYVCVYACKCVEEHTCKCGRDACTCDCVYVCMCVRVNIVCLCA